MKRKNPFKHLDFFTERDAPYFFGREEITKEILGHVVSRKTNLLFGESGSGKTSLVNAALIPALREEAGAIVVYERYYGPLLRRMTHKLERETGVDLSIFFQATTQQAAVPFDRVLSKLNAGQDRKLVIVLDQFEEIFTHKIAPEERDAFFDDVIRPLNSYPDIHFLFVMRADYFTHLYPYRADHEELWNKSIRLTRLDKDGAIAAIAEPLRLKQMPFEEAVVGEIYRDLRAVPDMDESPGQEPFLPFLQMTCYELFQQGMARDQAITLALYHEMGGVEAIVDRFFREVFRGFENERLWVERILANLAHPDGTRRILPREELLEPFPQADRDRRRAEGTLKSLIGKKIVRQDADLGTYELVHDLLAKRVAANLEHHVWLAKLRQDLDYAWQKQRFDLSIEDVGHCFRVRHAMNWTNQRLKTAFLCAAARRFPVDWWREALCVCLGNAGFTQFLVSSFQHIDQPKMRVELVRLLAARPSTDLPLDLLQSFLDEVQPLETNPHHGMDLRLALLGLFTAWKVPPRDLDFTAYLSQRTPPPLKRSFLDWIAATGHVENGRLIQKWDSINNAFNELNQIIMDADLADEAFTSSLADALGRTEAGRKSLTNTWKHLIDSEGKPALPVRFILDIARNLPRLDPGDLDSLFHHMIDHAREYLPKTGPAGFWHETLPLLQVYGQPHWLTALWEQVRKERITIPDDRNVKNALAKLLGPANEDPLVEDLDHDVWRIQYDAFQLLLCHPDKSALHDILGRRQGMGHSLAFRTLHTICRASLDVAWGFKRLRTVGNFETGEIFLLAETLKSLCDQPGIDLKRLHLVYWPVLETLITQYRKTLDDSQFTNVRHWRDTLFGSNPEANEGDILNEITIYFAYDERLADYREWLETYVQFLKDWRIMWSEQPSKDIADNGNVTEIFAIFTATTKQAEQFLADLLYLAESRETAPDFLWRFQEFLMRRPLFEGNLVEKLNALAPLLPAHFPWTKNISAWCDLLAEYAGQFPELLTFLEEHQESRLVYQACLAVEELRSVLFQRLAREPHIPTCWQESLLPFLDERLGDIFEGDSDLILQALSHRPNPTLAGRLAELLDSPYSSEREAEYIRALDRMGHQQLLPKPEKYLFHADHEVRQAAIQWTTHQNPDLLARHLESLVASCDERGLHTLLECLKTWGDEEVFHFLAKRQEFLTADLDDLFRESMGAMMARICHAEHDKIQQIIKPLTTGQRHKLH
ncbi:MAG: ATP-binding protein [Acidobacteriota bacterium]|nr:ATP-binding protein [Acidobacteriota bacterium]